VIVTKASASDKDQVLEFCQNTFSWGDYIADVWDSWIDEGDLLVIHKNNSPIAICHASTNKEGKQTWIEGIRVNQLFRRKGYASTLIKEAEIIAKLSKVMTLEKGDIISTGTPAGVILKNPNLEYLKDGDEVEMEIENLGRINNTIHIKNN